MTDAEAGVMPVVTVYPECSTCGAAFVLRLTYYVMGPKAGQSGWLWSRDCKHKSEPKVIGGPADGR